MYVSPLQGWGKFLIYGPGVITPGYDVLGFQPDGKKRR